MISRRSRSRTRSSSRSRRKRPDLPPFFLDENVAGKELVEALRSLGLTVKLSQEEFGRGAADTTWLPKIGRSGWILLSKDRAIGRRESELEALRRAGVRAFFFAYGDLTSAEMVDSFRKALDRISRAIHREKPPFLRRITPSGALTKL